MSKHINRFLESAMTVSELVELLQVNYAPDAKVVFGCSYGDRHHTFQLFPVREDEVSSIEEIGGSLEETAYSSTGVALDPEAEVESHTQVVVLGFHN